MIYMHDYKYTMAKKVIDDLGDDEKDQLIKYYIQKHKEWSDVDKEKLKEYQEVFNAIGKFIPHKGATVYGG